MAALVAGVQYGLASQGHFNENKSLIFVKLTDSALRAIEDYLKNRNKCSQSPTIQFLGNEGQFSLPNSRTAAAKFKFSLSSDADMEPPQGSFECIQRSGQNRCLETVGPLPCKMRVQANDDIYATTKSKMKEVEKLQKENCTREIELDKTGIGRRIKSRTKPMPTNGRRVTPSNPANQGATPPSGHTPPVLGHTRPQGNNHAQKPGNPELMKRPLRERIIHLLALRPYKKPELFMTLSREGLSPKDRNSLMNTISSVAKTERDNSYHLLRHIWNDVQDDWPFYSEQDRVVLKRRKPENLTPPASSDGSSPSSVTPGSPPSAAEPVVNVAKRPGYVDGADGLPTKRPRISHYKKPSYPGSGGGGGGGLGTPGGGGGYPPGGYGGGFGFVTSTTSPVQPHLPSPQPARGAMPHPSPPTPPEDNTGPPESPSPYSPPSSTTIPSTTIPSTQTQNVLPKYMMDYTTIKDVNQRRKYKEDFNNNYKEYRLLHAMVEKVSKRFTLLDEKLKKEERGSDGWQRIKDQIMREYEENKRNSKHQDAKRRFQYLHEKLSYIKKLVLDYDSKNS